MTISEDVVTLARVLADWASDAPGARSIFLEVACEGIIGPIAMLISASSGSSLLELGFVFRARLIVQVPEVLATSYRVLMAG